MAGHSIVLDWRIPGTGESGGLPSAGSHSRTRLKQLSSSSSSNLQNRTTWTSKYYACCFGGTDKIQLPNKLFLFLLFILFIFIDFILVKRIGNLIFCKVGTFLIKEGERNTNIIAGRFS